MISTSEHANSPTMYCKVKTTQPLSLP